MYAGLLQDDLLLMHFCYLEKKKKDLTKMVDNVALVEVRYCTVVMYLYRMYVLYGTYSALYCTVLFVFTVKAVSFSDFTFTEESESSL